MTTTVEPRPRAAHPAPAASSAVRRWADVVLALAVLGAAAYGLLAQTPYRSLSESTVLGAQAQDACSVLVALVLLALAARPVAGTATELVRLGLLGYLAYSYLIYVSGGP